MVKYGKANVGPARICVFRILTMYPIGVAEHAFLYTDWFKIINCY